MPIPVTESELQSFREQLYQQFNHRADSAMDLLDALCSNDHAPSVVHLSLNPLFRGGYSSLFKAIGASLSCESSETVEEQDAEIEADQGVAYQCLDLISQVIPQPRERPFLLLGQDCTSIGRPFAKTLKDRGMVHHPTPIKGNKPITIGHSYSLIAVLPERDHTDAPWTLPLDMSRVPTASNSTQTGIAQIKALFSHPSGSSPDQLCALVVDSAYGNKNFLVPLRQHENLVAIARVRSNRVFYQSPMVKDGPPRPGHPTWYGERFDLKDHQTWHDPTQATHTSYPTRRGRRIDVTITAWEDMLMRGSKAMPAHQCPFTLLRVESVDESGKIPFQPMWLIIIGQRRSNITLAEAYHAYRQRFDLEHTFRFQKQNLLLNTFETPEVEHEQQWVYLVMLAYVQLWAAHALAIALPRPWESYLKTDASTRISPSKVQQDWNRIISQLGTPAAAPKPRGKSSGRQLGQTQPLRPRLPVVKKGKSQRPVSQIAA